MHHVCTTLKSTRKNPRFNARYSIRPGPLAPVYLREDNAFFIGLTEQRATNGYRYYR